MSGEPFPPCSHIYLFRCCSRDFCLVFCCFFSHRCHICVVPRISSERPLMCPHKRVLPAPARVPAHMAVQKMGPFPLSLVPYPFSPWGPAAFAPSSVGLCLVPSGTGCFSPGVGSGGAAVGRVLWAQRVPARTSTHLQHTGARWDGAAHRRCVMGSHVAAAARAVGVVMREVEPHSIASKGFSLHN